MDKPDSTLLTMKSHLSYDICTMLGHGKWSQNLLSIDEIKRRLEKKSSDEEIKRRDSIDRKEGEIHRGKRWREHLLSRDEIQQVWNGILQPYSRHDGNKRPLEESLTQDSYEIHQPRWDIRAERKVGICTPRWRWCSGNFGRQVWRLRTSPTLSNSIETKTGRKQAENGWRWDSIPVFPFLDWVGPTLVSTFLVALVTTMERYLFSLLFFAKRNRFNPEVISSSVALRAVIPFISRNTVHTVHTVHQP